MSDPMDFFRSLIASLPPGTPFLVGRTPAGEVITHVGPTEEAKNRSSADAAASDASGSSALDVTRALEARHGGEHVLKFSEWVDLLPRTSISERALERAVAAKALELSNAKLKGRGNRARLITVRAMLQFLEGLELGEGDSRAA